MAHIGVLAAALALFVAAVVTDVHAQTNPLLRPLLTGSELTNLSRYTFQYPDNDGAGTLLAYGGGAIGVSEDGNYLYVSCQQDDMGIAKIEIPAPGGMARVVAPCQGPKRADIAKIHPDPNAWRPVVGGVMELGGQVCVTGFIIYDASGGATASHWCGPSLTQLRGPFAGTVPNGLVKSQMAAVPVDWRALLGGSAMSSAGYSSIVSRSSYGAAITIFDPVNVTHDGFPMQMLLGCPHSVSSCLTYGTPTSNDYNGSEHWGGMFIAPGSRTLVAVERESSGPTCYGYATTNPAMHGTPYPGPGYDAQHVVWCYSMVDPPDQKAPMGYPYRLVAKLYDMAELVAVKQGLKQPSDIRQYATVDLPGSSPNEMLSSGAYNPVRNEFYLLRSVGGGPVTVYVYSVGSVVPGGGGGGGAVTPTPANLQAAVTGSSVLLSWLGVSNGTVSNYVAEAGTGPGLRDITLGAPLGLVSSYLATNVPIGRYYIRLRAVGPAGTSATSNEVVAVVGGTVSTVTPPGDPKEFRAMATGPGAVRLTWYPPESGSPPLGYLVEVGRSQGATDLGTAQLPLGTSFSAGGVPPGVYYLRIRAGNSAGLGPPSGEVRLVVP